MLLECRRLNVRATDRDHCNRRHRHDVQALSRVLTVYKDRLYICIVSPFMRVRRSRITALPRLLSLMNAL